MTKPLPIKIHSPAKVNLYLHVTGRKDNGYHQLESALMFCGFGDTVAIQPSSHFSFKVSGEFSGALDDVQPEDNLAVKTAYFMAKKFGRDLNIEMTLDKYIPLGAGLGGGSSNAGAVARGLLQYWGIDEFDKSALSKELVELGADVPSCFISRPLYIDDVGFVSGEFSLPESLPTLLVYPNQGCFTPEVFSRFSENPVYKQPQNLPAEFSDRESFLEFVKGQSNDLTVPATHAVPVIQDVLDVLSRQRDAVLTRMTGSGACCFAVFESEEGCQKSAQTLKQQHPAWWVMPTVLRG